MRTTRTSAQFMQMYEKKPDLRGLLAWSIVATLFFPPLGVVAIIKAVKARKQQESGEYELSEKTANTADILSLISFAVALLISFAVPLLPSVFFGLIGALDGRHRTCGLAGGFFLGSIGLIVGWIAIPCFSWKGQDNDAWLGKNTRISLSAA